MSIEKQPSRWMQKLLLTPIRAFIEHRSHITVSTNATKTLTPPYVILSNHVNNWDPLLINCYIDEPICFVAGNSLFRHPLLKKVLHYTGAIPKTKFKNDTSTIRQILNAKKHQRVIGIFPEGNRNWDGVTESLNYTTAKLIKSLNVPVVIAKIRGGHLSHPRWADSHRKGPITLSFEKLWTPDDLSALSTDMVHHTLSDVLYHNDADWQAEHQLRYHGKNLAHYLERLLFICPHCEQPGQLYSDSHNFSCQACGYHVRYTTEGHFTAVQQPLYFSTPYQWNAWQLTQLEHTLYATDQQQHWQQALSDHVALYTSADDHPFVFKAKGYLAIQDDQLSFTSDQQQIDIFPLSQFAGINIQFHHKLDFFYDNQLYRIIFYQPRTSAYKWLRVIQMIQSYNQQDTKDNALL